MRVVRVPSIWPGPRRAGQRFRNGRPEEDSRRADPRSLARPQEISTGRVETARSPAGVTAVLGQRRQQAGSAVDGGLGVGRPLHEYLHIAALPRRPRRANRSQTRAATLLTMCDRVDK